MERELGESGPRAQAAWPAISAQAGGLASLGVDRVAITGCGDSFYAGLSAAARIEAATGFQVLALPAMEAAAFPGVALDRRCLLVGISVSGRVERTVEALAHHRSRGGPTLAVTANTSSALAAEADFVIDTGMGGASGPVPGTGSYLGSLLALLAAGDALAGSPGRSTADVGRSLEAVELSFAPSSASSAIAGVADRLDLPFYILGSGPDAGSANFGVAKFIEAASVVGVAQDVEEWAHEQYFTTTADSTVIIVCTLAPGRGRAARVARSATRLGAGVVSVGFPLGSAGEVNLPGPTGPGVIPELWSWAPLARCALTYARATRRLPFGIEHPLRLDDATHDIYAGPPQEPA